MPLRVERSTWGARMRSILDGADIVFLDTDNGVGGETEKHGPFPKSGYSANQTRDCLHHRSEPKHDARHAAAAVARAIDGRASKRGAGRTTPPQRPDDRLRLYTGYLNSASPVILMHSHVIRPTMISDSVPSGHMS